MTPTNFTLTPFMFTKELRAAFREMMAREFGLIGGQKIDSVEVTKKGNVVCWRCRTTPEKFEGKFYRIVVETADYKKHPLTGCDTCYKLKVDAIKRHLNAEVNAVFPTAFEPIKKEDPKRMKKGIEILGEFDGPRKPA